VTLGIVWFAALEVAYVFQLRASVLSLTPSSPNGAAPALLFGGLVVIIAMAVTIEVLHLAARGPEELTLSDAGIQFEFSNGRTAQYGWSDSRLRLRLVESKPVERGLGGMARGPSPEPLYGVRALRPRRWPITPTAFESILDECRRRGLDFTSRTRSSSPYTITSYLIRPAR
jgi:hypothetical protein